MRRILFQVHLWLGVLASIYLLVVCLSGAALLFRPQLQRAIYPALFTPTAGPLTDPATVIERVHAAYPQYRVSGVDAPTTDRPTYLSYVSAGNRFLTVLIDPVTARVLGELPEQGAIRALQSLHFNLLSGTIGRKVNGVGAVCLLVLALTGAIIWWPGKQLWRRRLTVDFAHGWRTTFRELHTAVAIWVFLFVAMWAFTGFYFAYPAQFRAGVGWISTIARVRTPVSAGAGAEGNASPDWRALMHIAQQQRPAMNVARVVLPLSERGAVQVLFSPQSPTPAGSMALQSVYLDQYTGQVLKEAPRTARSVGDVIMTWAALLHVGNFGGQGVRVLWFLLGLAPPLLAVTGLVMWWTRVVRGRR